MIGTEGQTDTGKSEFILSCPGPGVVICVDRGIDPLFDNPNPPQTRRDDFGIKFIEVPTEAGAATQPQYLSYFQNMRQEVYNAIAIPEVLTVAVDGDSDFWELQVLAEFGKKAQIWPQTRWGDVYAARRTMTSKWHDSGKIIIGTNKLKDEYETVIDPTTGLPQKEKDGSDMKKKTGRLERQGFKDQDYLWNIQIRHLKRDAQTVKNPITGKTREVPRGYGIRILKCKSNPDLVGAELWDDECNFAGLVQFCYPNIDMAEWGL